MSSFFKKRFSTVEFSEKDLQGRSTAFKPDQKSHFRKQKILGFTVLFILM